jgi:hypothetical protein
VGIHKIILPFFFFEKYSGVSPKTNGNLTKISTINEVNIRNIFNPFLPYPFMEEFKMKEKKIIPIIIVGVIISVSLLSGCVRPWVIDTGGWDHTNVQGTSVRLWGRLKLTESPDNWNEGFVWDTESHSDWQDYQYRAWADNHAGLGLFSLEISNLSRTTTYHYRAFGEYLKGQNQFGVGNDLTFIPGGPRVNTDNASNIGLTDVTLQGNLWHLGGASTCNVYFLYGTDINALNEDTPIQVMNATGTFSAHLTGLVTNTTYFFKAVADNDADAWAGIIRQVTPGRPVVVTRQPAEIGKDYAILKGELWHTGGTSECDVWFAYSDKSPNQLDQSSLPQTMNATGPFQATIGNLSASTKYWYRTVADNGLARSVGDIYEFTTTPSADIIKSGESAKPYKPFSKTTDDTMLSKIPTRYLRILEKHPMLLKLLQQPRFQRLLQILQ